MKVNFEIVAIENKYHDWFSLNEEALLARGAIKSMAEVKPGYPCRVSLQDAEIGEKVLLFSFQHHKTHSPYQASGPIFIKANAQVADLAINEVPEMLSNRFLSLRIYDSNGIMIDATTLEGKTLKKEIETILQNHLASYIQIHNAKPGC